MNLYTALRAGFPADLDTTAIDADGALYTWRDLERGSAMLANWLGRLDLPAGSRVAVHTDKSAEGLLLYLAVLRSGLVYLPLNPAYQASELEHFLTDAAPGVVVCAGRNFGWLSQMAFQRGVRWVFTLNDDRTGTLLDRAALYSYLSGEATKLLGPFKGYAFALEVERADSLAALQALALQLVERVQKAKGEAAAAAVREALGLR